MTGIHNILSFSDAVKRLDSFVNLSFTIRSQVIMGVIQTTQRRTCQCYIKKFITSAVCMLTVNVFSRIWYAYTSGIVQSLYVRSVSVMMQSGFNLVGMLNVHKYRVRFMRFIKLFIHSRSTFDVRYIYIYYNYSVFKFLLNLVINGFSIVLIC